MEQEEFFRSDLANVLEQWRSYLSILGPCPQDLIIDIGCDSGMLNASYFSNIPILVRLSALKRIQRGRRRPWPNRSKTADPLRSSFTWPMAVSCPGQTRA